MNCPSCGHGGWTMASCNGACGLTTFGTAGVHYHVKCNICNHRWISSGVIP